jgi:hypothetical protein
VTAYRVARIAAVDICPGDVTAKRSSALIPTWREPVVRVAMDAHYVHIECGDGTTFGYHANAHVKIKLERPA